MTTMGSPQVPSKSRLHAWLANIPRPPFWLIVGFAVVISVAAFLYVAPYFVEGTDDAYIEADTIPVAPKISGYVSALHVSDNTHFKKGQLLLEIDPRDYLSAQRRAAADYASALAMEQNARIKLQQQAHVIAASQAGVTGDSAALDFSRQQLTRYEALASNGAGSAERWQQAMSDIKQKAALLSRDIATTESAQSELAVLQTNIAQAAANASMRQAELMQADLNLSYTRIYALSNGTVANRTVQAGSYLQPGQTLFSAVPEALFVMANFKETQLSRLRIGQAVSLKVDAYPDLQFKGHVQSFQRGTGANFALLPPENATGNFIKIVQRVPVKITLDGSPENISRLAPGMSVETQVIIRKAPDWLDYFGWK